MTRGRTFPGKGYHWIRSPAIVAAALLGCGEVEPYASSSQLTFFEDAATPPSPVQPEPAQPDAGAPFTPTPTTFPSDPAPPIPIDPDPTTPTASNEPPPPPTWGPPNVNDFTPDHGVWGTHVTITGVDLGSAARTGVQLDVGGTLTLAPDDDAVTSWSENEIVVRIPFPHLGSITVETPQGEATAGSFTPDWQLGPEHTIPSGSQVVASISPAPGTIFLALDTAPLIVLSLHPDGWQEVPLTAAAVDPATFRFYLTADGKVEAFALEPTEERTLITFAADTDFEPTVTSFHLAEEYALAGGPLGGVVWHRTEQGWERLVSSPAGWEMDKGPIADPNPSASQHTPGATSDGSLFVLYSVDTGNFLDDTAAPFFQRLAPAAQEFEARLAAGISVDDYLTRLDFVDRGRGFLVEYCGSDVDPFAITGTAYRCYSAAHSPDGDRELQGLKESDGARYTFTQRTVGVGYCDEMGNTRVSSDRLAREGAIVAWPCTDLEALEFDPMAAWVPVLRVEDILYPVGVSQYLANEPDPNEPEPPGLDLDGGAESDAGADGGT